MARDNPDRSDLSDLRLVAGKSEREIVHEWDQIAEERNRQFESLDVSLRYHVYPSMLDLLSGRLHRRVLDVGCGTGHFTTLLAGIYRSVVAIDPSERFAQIAADRCRCFTNVQVLPLTVESFSSSSPEPFDTIVANLSLMSTRSLPEALSSISSMLEQDGWLAASITHPCFFPVYWGYASIQEFDYFGEVAVEADFRVGLKKTGYRTTHFHRPLEHYIEGIRDAGMLLERFVEPRPPQQFPGESNTRFPRFLLFLARKAT